MFDPWTTTGAFWPEGEPVPADFLAAFQNTSDPFDGLIQLSPEWLVKNMPELTGLKFVMTASICMSMAAVAAIEAVGRGMGQVVVAVKGWHNIPGRYGQRGAHAQDTVSGPGKYGRALAGPPVYGTAMQFQRYLHKYNKTHDMMAPFVVNSRANGLKFPEGYWYQHRPTPLTTEEYLESRWVAEPANLYDNDIPIHTAAAYLFTTAERARDLRQPPAYVLGHASGGRIAGDYLLGFKPRSTIDNLEETQEWAARTARRLYESAGITASDVDFENAYDGFSLFHVFWIEGFGFFGIKEGEAWTSSPARTSPSTGRRRSRPAAGTSAAAGPGSGCGPTPSSSCRAGPVSGRSRRTPTSACAAASCRLEQRSPCSARTRCNRQPEKSACRGREPSVSTDRTRNATSGRDGRACR